MTTRWISAYMPELHEEGYVKWTSNVEKFRGYISTHRADASYSALYAAHQNVFVNMEGNKRKGEKDAIYRMDTVQKTLLDTFLTMRNQGLLFSKSNINPATGKPNIVDPKNLSWGLAA
jgi:hypothetical protein